MHTVFGLVTTPVRNLLEYEMLKEYFEEYASTEWRKKYEPLKFDSKKEEKIDLKKYFSLKRFDKSPLTLPASWCGWPTHSTFKVWKGSTIPG